MGIDFYDSGRVGPAGSRKQRLAGLRAAEWALDRESPEEDLQVILEALGMIGLPDSQRCTQCRRDRPASHFVNEFGRGRVTTCRICRDANAARRVQ